VSAKDIGVMGSPDFVLGFNLAGVRRTYPVADPQEAARTLEKVLAKGDNLGILIVQSADMAQLPPLLRKKASESLEPVIVAMGEGAGQDDLREKVKRAIGIDIVK
jgi:V/A-type H+/Na+-transporting ATPase subunit F